MTVTADLVARLKGRTHIVYRGRAGYNEPDDLCQEAAEEIETLRAALAGVAHQTVDQWIADTLKMAGQQQSLTVKDRANLQAEPAGALRLGCCPVGSCIDESKIRADERNRLRAAPAGAPSEEDVARLKDALRQALRQWSMYADMVEHNEGFDLSKEQSPEGEMYRAALALAGG